jgi:primosomal protein N' (replication factor Y)
MGEGERFDEWRRVHEGQARIVIGARSAVFAPLENLGLVVVDEEHDGSYKQDEAPRYQGRDAAIMRAHQNGAVVLLGSATPSLESSHNVALGKLERMLLPSRIEDRPMPQVEILDLKRQPRQKGSPLFTSYLVECLREVLLKKEQAILFLNRRGFANLVRCPDCEYVVVCDHCSISLTYHSAEKRLRCHRCDFNRPMPASCPDCGGAAPVVLGLGTERIEQEMAVIFPDARILRMDSDTLRRRGELERMLEGIRNRDYDLIIGTQVLSKGHDYPHITLVGAVLADVSLNLPDFRSAERTFQLLTQMAGRAGRGALPGRVLIQTYSPEHYSLEMVRTHDTPGFTALELQSRQDAGTPPYCSQTLIWVTGPREDRVQALAHEVAQRLRAVAAGSVQVLGAVEGPIRKIKNRFRWMILLRSASIGPIHALLNRVLDDPTLRLGAKERIAVDVDPYHVM